MVYGEITRRRLLHGAGAGVALGGMVGTAGANDAGDYVVGVRNRRGVEQARERAESVERVLDFDDIGKAVAGRFSPRAIEALAGNPNVRYVEEDGEMHAVGQTLPWGVDRVDADVLHDDGETGDGADVAVIDTGIDSDHPDLGANLGSGKAYVDCTGSNCNEPWDDDNDHGTHCAGIADAVDNSEGVVGVATEATLHAVKVLDGNGSGSFSDVAAGIEYTADQGWDVGSLSLGTSSGSQTVKDACTYAYEKGVLLVAAAGNDGPCSDCVGYPAAYEECIAVSSTDSDDTLSSFSSTGPEVELAAPGGEIYSTVIGGYDTFSGTSMACPHVSGAGGQLMANGYANTEARQRLQDTAEDLELSSSKQGYGLLDVEAAVLDGSDGASVAVSTGDATDVGTDAATLNGSLDDLGGADSADCYFEYREAGSDTWNTTGEQTLSSTGSFSEDVSGLASGTDYEFRAIAEASDGDADTGATNTFATDSSSGDSAPAIDRFDLTDDGNPAWTRYYVDWAVSDGDDDLSTVTCEMVDGSGNVLDSETSSVSGSSVSGTHYLETKSDASEIALTVTDEAGNSTSDSKSI
jgi:subtilisin